MTRSQYSTIESYLTERKKLDELEDDYKDHQRVVTIEVLSKFPKKN